jgi:hypothetical protein
MAKGKKASKKWHAAPLKASFMATSIVGFLITAYMVYPSSRNYGVSFFLIFVTMFVASLVSMTKAPLINEN